MAPDAVDTHAADLAPGHRPQENPLTATITRRMWQMIPNPIGVILLVFTLLNWVGGDPAYVHAGRISGAEEIANIRKQRGADQPHYVQRGAFAIATRSWAQGRRGK
jgi:ABC-type dipeptide/oligopeptide/nickel transport system permease component